MFEEDLPTGHALPVCPFPVGTPSAERPCAIERYLAGDPQPRVVRRLQYDALGRVERYSDHQAGRAVEARRLVHEAKPGTLNTEVYAVLCESPTPRYLYHQRLRFDDAGRLTALEPEFGKGHRISYHYEPGWLQDRQLVQVDAGKRVLKVDAYGHVVRVRESGKPDIDLDLTVRNGRVVVARWVEGARGEIAQAEYTYSGKRLVALQLRSAAGVEQRYRFVYECTEVPTCSPDPLPAPRPIGPSQSAMSWDPNFTQFKARSCSDQHRNGPRLCGEVDLPPAGLQVRCCDTDKPGIQLELHSGLAGADITALVLSLPDGAALSSVGCRGRRAFSDCRFVREDMLGLPPGTAQLQIRTEQGTIESLAVDTRWFIEAAR